MKRKIEKICAFIIFLILFVVCDFYFQTNKQTLKVLKVVEADEFYLDLNYNDKADDNELCKLKDVIAFYPEINDFSKRQAKRLNIKIKDYIFSGYLAKKWAKENLEGKYLDVIDIETFENSSYKFITAYFNNVNLAQFYLENGLGFLKENFENPFYVQFQNLKQTKTNTKELENSGLVVVNLKSKVYHKPNCENIEKISNVKIIPLNEVLDKYKPCSVCAKPKEQIQVINDIDYVVPKSQNTYKTSVHKKYENIELFLINPLIYKSPNNSCVTDICKAIVKEINLSETSIDLALYGVGEQDEIIKSLRNAKNRGVKIRSVVDYSLNMDNIYPNTSSFATEFGSVMDDKESFMHNKFMIFDNKKVLTSSANVSSTGTGGYNSNNAILVNSSELAQIYTNEFEKMYGGNFSTKKQKSEKNCINLNKDKICAYFSPKDALNNVILDELTKAKKEIFVSIFYLTERNLIQELINAKKRGVEVLVLIDAVGASNFKERIQKLRQEKIPVIVENWGGKNHEKTIMVDGEVFITGSSNFSKNAFYKNDENILVMNNKEIAQVYRDYYLFLFNSIDKKFLKYYPKAEGMDSINSCFDGIDNNFDGKIDSQSNDCKVE